MLVAAMLDQALTINPGLRVEFSVPGWMEAVVEAAEACWFRETHDLLRDGVEIVKEETEFFGNSISLIYHFRLNLLLIWCIIL